MSHQGFDTTFKEFKENFYSKIGDGTCFDVMDINLLKVVLDGLKVRYNKKGKIFDYMSLPTWLILLYYFIRVIKDFRKRQIQNRINLTLKGVKFLAGFSSNIINAEGQNYSAYFHNLYSKYGRSNFCFIKTGSDDRIDSQIIYSKLPLGFNIFSIKNIKLLLELKKKTTQMRKSKMWLRSEQENINIATFIFLTEYYKFDLLFKSMKFEVAIIDGHYHYEGFILACKRHNITVVELQHGLISKEDIFYVFPNQVSDIIEKALFADYIFVYGQYWKNVLLTGCEYKEKQIEILGYYHYQIDSISGKFENKKPYILITTQYSVEMYYIDYIKFLSSKLKDDWHLIVKIHPVESMSIYSELTYLPNVSVVDESLDLLIKDCEFLISIFSTTLFDAVRNGKLAFSLNLDLFKDYVDDVVSTGAIHLLQPWDDPVAKYYALRDSQTVNNIKLYYEDYSYNSSLDRLLNLK